MHNKEYIVEQNQASEAVSYSFNKPKSSGSVSEIITDSQGLTKIVYLMTFRPHHMYRRTKTMH